MADPFKHVVLLMLENQSFDRMLGALQAVFPDLDGVAPGAPPRTNRAPGGQLFEQRPNTGVQVTPDPKHEHDAVMVQLEGDNAGFVRSFVMTYGRKALPACAQVMGYFPLDFLPALHPLAREFTVCDRWFSSLPGPTWPNRSFALSGTSRGHVRMPPEAFGMLLDQKQRTVFDCLDDANASWRVYFYDFPASMVLANQRQARNLQRYHRVDRFFDDCREGGRGLPELVFIEPKYFGVDQNDDHPPHNVMKAQKLVADVYNAIRSNPTLWKETLLVVAYDEHGGFYDHVPPPAAVPPGDGSDEYVFDRLGVRVPAILVSPWLERRVDHTVFDHTSVLRYLVDKHGLAASTPAPLGKRVAAATSIAAAFPREWKLREDTVPFLRVANSALVSPDPDLERNDANNHHAALHVIADTLLGGADDALATASAAAADAAGDYEHGIPRWLARLGDLFIALGRWLRGPLERKRHARITRTHRAIDQAIAAAGTQRPGERLGE